MDRQEKCDEYLYLSIEVKSHVVVLYTMLIGVSKGAGESNPDLPGLGGGRCASLLPLYIGRLSAFADIIGALLIQ